MYASILHFTIIVASFASESARESENLAEYGVGGGDDVAKVDADRCTQPLTATLSPQHERVDDDRHQHVERRRQNGRLDATNGADRQQDGDAEHDDDDRRSTDDHDAARVAYSLRPVAGSRRVQLVRHDDHLVGGGGLVGLRLGVVARQDVVSDGEDNLVDDRWTLGRH